MHAKLVATFGLDEEENAFIEKHLPQKECGIMDTDVVTDIIAIDEFAVIVRADAMSQSDMEMLYDFYGEVAPLSETVIFIGDVTVPANLKNHIAVYKDFDTLKENLKYILLSAYRKQKKSENFSATLANAILILSTIRRQPYITSAELAEKLEISPRSVQRYIETLRVAGEWIEYDTTHKGWYLQVGKSVLWGDFDED
ncbi:HTH domain-containing protein [uncultured Clostridium sp.]|uniref:HTH domain-containing protein n=1 Tax=uncultured Clostridium sp. TaxID=59620 RepID=UPI00265F2D77|nr:HTH domain-containing protein [uncultured Clostridium sp.]